MEDGYSSRGRTERPFPRASINVCSASGTDRVKGDRMGSALDHSAFSLPGQGGSALASVPSSAWLRGCSQILIVSGIQCDALVRICISLILWLFGRGPAFLLHLLLTASRQSLLVRANLQSITHCLGPIGLHLHSPCFMARKRGRPRRGSAWEAHKAQRRRKEELERALAMATSILRKKNRAERRARLAIITEPGVGSSQHVKENESEVLQKGGPEEEFPPCIVVEVPSMVDMPSPAQTRMAPHQEACKPSPTLLDYTPGCIVEEIPWPGEDTCSCQGTQANVAGLKDAAHIVEQEGAEANVEQEGHEAGSEAAEDVGGSMHNSLVRDEHLAMMIDIRGHLMDLEYRALLWGQRMDMLFDAFSNAPAKRRCPLCAQAFAIPTYQHG
jgi:hypothetical protein